MFSLKNKVAYFVGLPRDSNYLEEKREYQLEIDHRGDDQVIQRTIKARRDKGINWT